MSHPITEILGKSWMIHVAGNGGSASTASHFVTDLMKIDYGAVSLNDNPSLITMIANDYGYDQIFSFQLERLARTVYDVFVAISASGNSPNILRAVEAAKKEGMVTIGLTGFDGGKLAKIVDHHYNFPSDSYEEIEDAHLALLHHIIKELKE